MLGAFMIVLLSGILIYVICVCLAVSALGERSGIRLVFIMVACVVAFLALLFFAPEIVNMKINISF